MSSKYTIHHAGFKSDSHDLLGLEIEQTADGFVLVAPRRELSAVSLVNLHGKPIMKFHVKDFQGLDWTIFVDQMSPSEMKGTWCNGKDCLPGATAEADSWTASGSGAGEPGDDEAQSASAGYRSH
jgi:hypothetical protein